jgi:hypothetical protein
VGLNYVNGPREFSGALDTAYGWYRSTRIVTIGDESGAADAKPRQWQMGLHLHGGYIFSPSNNLYAKPFVDGYAIRVTGNAFTEEGTSPPGWRWMDGPIPRGWERRVLSSGRIC